MEIKQLKYFVEVAKREHISEAALELNIAQSAVSKHIHQLEQELHTALFYRRGRNVFLTPEGKRLLDDAERILEQIDLTVSQFQTQAADERHTIRIGYADGSVAQILPAVLTTIEQTLDVNIVPQMLNDTEIPQALQSQSIDIALTPSTLDSSDYHHTVLYEEHYAVYGHRDEPILNVPNPPLQSLLSHNLYVHEPLPTALKTYLQDHATSPVYTINHKQFARFVLQHEKGFVLAPTYLNLYSQNEQWKYVLLSHTPLQTRIHLIYRKPLSKPLMQEVIGILTRHLQQHTTYH
ncbi:glutamate biosynthesis transcriptional regulator GltC [Staphylococcus canis]|uniref:LysR family transcriptional regulator n=1 Tax=Staphylococcus canis TaxID=2724942 RepID=A0ABS0T8D1_9STAP|nr:LysR family transcriptional regulator [Staphylococcus canis]MBI5975011.1 LysR family transcriptional regulator [Staphylococcus canis]